MRTILMLGASALAFAAAGVAEAAEKLTLYCSPQEEWCQLMVTEFTKATGIEVAMTRKSSGETYAQIKAEASNPKGDVWWGGTGDPHLQAAEEGLTEPYDSPMLAELRDWALAQHKVSGGRTVGIYAGALGYGYNTDIAKKKGVAALSCWADLIKPELKGEVQVANPNSSGTSYTALATFVQMMGEDKAFEFLKALNTNVNQYTKSGSAPIKAAAQGETMVGIVFQHDAVTMKVSGAPIAVGSPCEGTGYEIGSMSIVKGARNMESAKKFYDFALTADIQSMAAKAQAYQVPSNKNAVPPPESPDFSQIKLIDYDFAKFGSAAERTRLLKRWDEEIGSLPR